ncbi:MAG TPA: YkgJ family cysteine cluster protein [Acidimicrobiales bacterium]|nr:YkgJ family cysteine cluster protein [Acidimicrobiales bacterium]
MPSDRSAIDFATWRAQFRSALERGGNSAVPCDGCTACCRSHQFVHIDDDETDTLAHIDPDLLVRTPGVDAHSWVMGYDTAGRCPQLTDTGCSIYEHRPRTCRTYDCRVFAAAGVRPDQPLVADRAATWVFTADDQVERCRDRAAQMTEPGRPPASVALAAVLG